jgi:acetyltransferase-like isoleucine patch superfamily enzyme
VVRIHVPKNPWDISLGEGVALDAGVILLAFGPRLSHPRITIGPSTYVNRGTMFDASLRITVGSDVMIGPYTYVTDHDHGMMKGTRVADAPLVEAEVTIDDGAWLGAGVTVLKGVSIGKGAMVGAGAVVTRDVPAGARVAGTPARVIGIPAGESP